MIAKRDISLCSVVRPRITAARDAGYLQIAKRTPRGHGCCCISGRE
jgi:hypothetical protein